MILSLGFYLYGSGGTAHILFFFLVEPPISVLERALGP